MTTSWRGLIGWLLVCLATGAVGALATLTSIPAMSGSERTNAPTAGLLKGV